MIETLEEIKEEVVQRLTAEIESEEEATPLKSKFQWKDKLGLVEALSHECADNGGKFDAAFRSIRLSDYAYYASMMPQRTKAALKREVIKKSKDIRHVRESAEIGDRVKVPKFIEGRLPGTFVRDGRKFVEAIVTSKQKSSSSIQYTVQRIADGKTQKGDGHMIKAVIARASSL